MYTPSFTLSKPVYQPAMRVITAITKAAIAQVTTSIPHQYKDGTIVRIDIPKGFGMFQINQQFGPITVTGDTTFTIPINTQNYDAFTIPSSFPDSYNNAQAVPVGELTSQLTAAVQNVLPYPAS